MDDMVESNSVLYKPGEKPDHTVVIKYVPYVGKCFYSSDVTWLQISLMKLPNTGDSKRAMDEYTSEIMMGGHNTLVIHNTCEDSLLASPIILDLVILTELCQRITFRGPSQTTYQSFHSVLSILSYLCKVRRRIIVRSYCETETVFSAGSVSARRSTCYQLAQSPAICHREHFPCLPGVASSQPHDA